MGKPSAPPTPDYVGAAQAQGAANVESARASAKLSNPNVTNPYGSRTVTYGVNGDPDQANVTESLTPVGQSLFDQQNRISSGLGSLAEGGIGRVGALLGSDFDMSQVRGRPELPTEYAGLTGRDLATKAIIDRNQPMADRRRAQMETQLSNQGIMRGSEAWKNAQDDLARQENDFNLGALQAGGQEQSRLFGLDQGLFSMGQQARQDDIQQQAYLRQLPLNEINALRSGAQVNVPQFQQYQGQQVAPAPIFAATQAQGQADINRYNAEAAQSGGFMNGLFSLGSSALSGGLFSDARLKENIKCVGYTNSGLPIYTYNYVWDKTPMMGVMAQEVMEKNPEAVMEHESGYLMVDYSKVH